MKRILIVVALVLTLLIICFEGCHKKNNNFKITDFKITDFPFTDFPFTDRMLI